MFYKFAADTFAEVIIPYDRPYADPIIISCGELVKPVLDGSRQTDIVGWTWCVATDGREGWVPWSWCEDAGDKWRLLRDFSALELTVRDGERLLLLHSESGFVSCRNEAGEQGWVPDGCLALVTPSS